jgi:hypothetical protein
VKEYQYPNCNNLTELAKIVNGFVHSGWECDGPMVYTGNGTDLDYYVQRMVKDVDRSARFISEDTEKLRGIVNRLRGVRDLVKPDYIKAELTEVIAALTP